MRFSDYLLPTERAPSAGAEIASHRLMLRAGMARQLASGLYTWLPLGLRVLRKVERIVREEMDASGALELAMPLAQPGELWRESGRWEQYGPELLRVKDRHGRDFCLGPTHEEVITDLARNLLSSHRQLPLNLYQIQTKFRDETRPRFGVIRAREFLMKDAYSFHIDQQGLDETYLAMREAYSRIFKRCGLDFCIVKADSGSIGGERSEEFHAFAEVGEDRIAISDAGDYAANVERAEAVAPPRRGQAKAAMSCVETGDKHSIDEVCRLLEIPKSRAVKTLVLRGDDSDLPLIAVVLRGDHTLNKVKAARLSGVAVPLVFATRKELQRAGLTAGAIGLNCGLPLFVDRAASALCNFCCGADEPGKHLRDVNWGRDFPEPKVVDVRDVESGDPSPEGGGMLSVRHGIEVGHIFQLGEKYSKALGALVQDAEKRALPLRMGCYGIGVSRVVAALIEQCHDERGIVWPEAVAPFQVMLIGLDLKRSPVVNEAAQGLYRELEHAGIETLFDDRDERPGVKFADADLIGLPHRVVIGQRALDRGAVEYRHRLEGSECIDVPLEQASAYIARLLSGAE